MRTVCDTSSREPIVLHTFMSFPCDRASILRASHKASTCTWQVGRSKKDMMLLRSGDMQWTPGCSRKGRQSRNKTNRNSTCTEQKSRSLHCEAGLRMNRSSWNCRHLCHFFMYAGSSAIIDADSHAFQSSERGNSFSLSKCPIFPTSVISFNFFMWSRVMTPVEETKKTISDTTLVNKTCQG